MKRLLEENETTEFERLLLGSIALDVPMEGAEATLLDRLDTAPVVPITTSRYRLRASTYLLVIAATIGIFVVLQVRKRHDVNIPIVQEEPLVTPVSSDLPAMQMPLPSAAPAPSVAKLLPPPRPLVSVVRRAPPVPTLIGPAPPPTTSSVAQSFDKGAAARALGQVDLTECQQYTGPSGGGHVTVTFAPEGHASNVNVDPPFAGTDRGTCIAAKFAPVTVPPFQGSASVRVGKSFVLQ